MPNIRKEKKRLKKRLKDAIAEQERVERLPVNLHNVFLYNAIADDIDQLKQELQQLKRKKV